MIAKPRRATASAEAAGVIGGSRYSNPTQNHKDDEPRFDGGTNYSIDLIHKAGAGRPPAQESPK